MLVAVGDDRTCWSQVVGEDEAVLFDRFERVAFPSGAGDAGGEEVLSSGGCVEVDPDHQGFHERLGALLLSHGEHVVVGSNVRDDHVAFTS